PAFRWRIPCSLLNRDGRSNLVKEIMHRVINHSWIKCHSVFKPKNFPIIFFNALAIFFFLGCRVSCF
ncbi:MAG: hypothetical protein ACOC35_15105, partial [Promethearchaeia archaeon]